MKIKKKLWKIWRKGKQFLKKFEETLEDVEEILRKFWRNMKEFRRLT